ncbi:BA14K family protein [Rhizobium sp. P38BS-XIX]|uniref:BA14K family protein n=1 Tax=Rhizobium sp. P38BS-XIX TaxID=2726740 RepID=UPI00145645B7|nr:BA14K family protein [Rhizobium sp. P38BS-XIX]NLS01125.1 BA14K family protein [Rhizobium sp. P38BS-XIX]
MKKTVSAIMLGSGLLLSSCFSANAFSLIAPALNLQSDGTKSESAYAGGANDAVSGAASYLSASEVRHVTWCASRYMSYHATDDTIEAKAGSRIKCQSPK